MPRYTLAFLPQEPQLAGDITAYAQRVFGKLADGHVLGDTALPHMTLCQFEADFAQLSEIWFATNHLFPSIMPLTFSGLHLRLSGSDDDVLWAEISIQRTPELVQGQRGVVAALAERRLTLHTLPGEAYTPHVTLARLKGHATLPAISLTPEHLWSMPHSFELSVGLCGEQGAYMERVF